MSPDRDPRSGGVPDPPEVVVAATDATDHDASDHDATVTTETEPAAPAPHGGESPLVRLSRTLARSNTLWTLVVLIGIVLAISIFEGETFLSEFNLMLMLFNIAPLVVVAVGMTYVIVTAGIDLSVGSVMVFSGVIAAKVMEGNGGYAAGWGGITIAMIAGMAAGLGWGLVNGLLITRAHIPPLIATLGTLGAAIGLARVISGGNDVTGIPRRFTDSVIGNALVLPEGITILDRVYLRNLRWMPLIVAAIAVLFALLLTMTRFGRHTYAVGSNPEAARRVGIRVDLHLVKVYTLSGFLAGVAGVLNLAKFTTTSLAGHQTDNLSAIAGVVIGGASLFGGVGTVAGSVIGVLIPGVLANGLVHVGVEPFWVDVALGTVLIIAVYFDQLRRRARERE